MQQATDQGNYKELQRLARLAEELADLEKQEQEIVQRRAGLVAMVEQPLESSAVLEEVSARERGNRVRNQYVEGILPNQGIRLKQIGTKKYQTPNGRLVGITYAKELKIHPNFWFLGLSDEQYDCVILLCESSDETGAEIAAFVFPPDFVKQIWNALSRSKRQVKLHVARTGYMNFELQLPGSRLLNISKYLNAVQLLNYKE